MAMNGEAEGDESDADASGLRDSCLLLFSNPFEETSSSSTVDREIELVPIVAQKRYIRATREFIEHSSSSSEYSESPSPIEVTTGMDSKTFKLPETSTRSKPTNMSSIARSPEVLQPAVYNPNETFAAMVARKENRHNRNLRKLYGKSNGVTMTTEAYQKSNSQYRKRCGELDTGCVDANYQATGEFMPTSVYNPNDYVLPTQRQKNLSEAIGIPSPKSGIGPNFENPCEDLEQTKDSHHDLSLETMMRTGVYDGDGNSDEDGFYISLSPKSDWEDDIDFGTVNVQETNVSQGRPQIDSVYAQVFAANPFGIDLSSRDDEDLSMRATLFPLKEPSVTHSTGKDAISRHGSPKGSTKSSSSSCGDQSEDDTAIMTKDFHQALSSIAKDKALPMLPPFGTASSKAMSLLGQRQSAQSSRTPVVVKGLRHKPKPLVLSNSTGAKATVLQPQRDSGKVNPYSQIQQLKDVLPLGTPKAANDSQTSLTGRPSKLDSLLGMSYDPASSGIQTPFPGKDNIGPKINSTLYNKLYSQVLKPPGSYRPESGLSAFFTQSNNHSKRNSKFLPRNVVEPVKRSTLSPTNPLFNGRSSPESPVSPYSGSDHSLDRTIFPISPLKIDKTRVQRKSVANSSNRALDHNGANNTSSSPSHTSTSSNQSSASSTAGNNDAYHAYKALEKMTAKIVPDKIDTHRLTIQDMAGLSQNLRGQVASKYNGALLTNKAGLSQRAGNQGTLAPAPIRRKPTPQQLASSGKTGRSVSAGSFPPPPAKLQPFSGQRAASFATSTQTSYTADTDHGFPYKRPRSPVKKMFSSTVEKIGRIIDVGNNNGFCPASNGVVVNDAAELKISIHPADQNRLFGDLEYIIQDTANRFLLFQHAHGRLSSHSVEKQARIWYQKNRPRVAQFLYPIAIQRQIVEQNLDTISFHGPLSGNATAIQAIMHTWKYVAQELAVRSFCLPDAGLQHFLRESSRLLELLGVAAGHMLHFQAWYNVVARTVREKYQIPYSTNAASF